MNKRYYLWYLLAIPFVIAAVMVGYGIGGSLIKDHLVENGYTDIELSYALVSSHPFAIQCSGKHPTIRSYTAKKNGKTVTGKACWNTFVGAKNWDD